jgi:hypothetical protein
LEAAMMGSITQDAELTTLAGTIPAFGLMCNYPGCMKRYKLICRDANPPQPPGRKEGRGVPTSTYFGF